jgi:Zn-dependent membrane protease YugP
MGYFIIAGVMTVVGMLVSNRLKSKFKQYRQVPLGVGLSGAEIAEKMLQHYNITNVQITQGQGVLTDHYNPVTRVVKLSPDIYGGRSVMAAAVAAHEVGHAVQHATAYPWLKTRSAIVPFVNMASTAQSFLLMFALGVAGGTGSNWILLITIIAFMVTAAFALVTLPVEFDASNRALAWLSEANMTNDKEYEGAKDALWWAAMTYVVKALSSLAMVVYLLMRYGSRR